MFHFRVQNLGCWICIIQKGQKSGLMEAIGPQPVKVRPILDGSNPGTIEADVAGTESLVEEC